MPRSSARAASRRTASMQSSGTSRLVGREEPTEFAIRTTSGPTPFKYRYDFSEDKGGTNLQLYAQVELGGIASMLGPLARRTVKKGVDDNLRTLKRLLGSGSPGPGG